MIMTLNDVLTKQNVITKILLQVGEKELSKEAKVKIMRLRMKYNKIKNQFDEDTQEFISQIVTDEFKELANKSERTEQEEAKYKELDLKINSEYFEYLGQKGREDIKESIDDSFSEEEYAEIVDVNSANDVELNGNPVKATDLLEIFYNLFVK
jgi:hypothetical protein